MRVGCDTCTNNIKIRGTPYPLGSGNRGYSEYKSQYTRNGAYSIFKKISGGEVVTLQGWIATPYINQGSAWNTLRVVANGSNLYFYINSNLVWSGSDTSLTYGRVGIGMFYSADTTGNQLWVDWATLSTSTGIGVMDSIPLEQQILNESIK